MQASAAESAYALCLMRMQKSLDGLEQCREAHAASDAERCNAELRSIAFAARHAREKTRHQNGAGCCKRVPARDRTAVGVDDVLVDFKAADKRDRLCGGRFAHLDDADV